MTGPAAEPVLVAEGLSRSYGEALVLDDVSLTIAAGEVHALLGENGAGKTTLIKIVTGVYSPDEGTLAIAGETVTLSSPHDASRRGIGVVYGGGRLGLMGAIADSALSAGGEVIGVIPQALVDAAWYRALTGVPPVEAMELLLGKLRKTPNNIMFLLGMNAS